MSSSTQSMGDRLKAYEPQSKLMQRSWVVARLDGRAFSKFTADLNKPFDSFFTDAMIATTKLLYKKYHCHAAYTQSDEITLVFNYTELSQGDMIFAGRKQKIASVLAGTASAKFIQSLMTLLPYKVRMELDADVPEFDCRVYCVPTLEEVANTVLWRQQDGVRNSIQMQARSVFSHKELNAVNSLKMREMLTVVGAPWEKIDKKFRFGTMFYRMYWDPTLNGPDVYHECQMSEQYSGADGFRKLKDVLWGTCYRKYVNPNAVR